MSFMPARPNMLARAAGDLQGVNASMTDGNAQAADPTTEVTPAAADMVSALVAAQFAAHAHAYQALSTQITAERSLLAETFGKGNGNGNSTGTGSRQDGEGGEQPAQANDDDDAEHVGHMTRHLRATAAAWEGLAANLHSTAAESAALIRKVADKHWQDPVAASMASGATHHVAWLASFADHAKKAAAQAEHAADSVAHRLFHSH